MNKEITDVMSEVDEIVGSANADLGKATEGNFPFRFDEVKLTVEVDPVAIYVKSGKTPVTAVVRRGDPNRVVADIEAEVRDVVEATRAAIERRAHLKAEADAVKAEGEKRRKAAAALKAAGLDAGIAGVDFDRDAARAVVEAARAAVAEANKGLDFVAGGGYRASRLAMRVYDEAGCLIVSADGRPCLITRFPKIGNGKTVDKTVKYIKADISALAESRRAYMATVRAEMDRAESLRSLAQDFEALEARAAAM